MDSEYTYKHIPGGTHYWLCRDGIQLGIVDKLNSETAKHFNPKKGLPPHEIEAAMDAVAELETHGQPPVNVGFDDEETDDDE